MTRLSRVTTRSVRVALVSTAIVAALYVVAAAAVTVIVDQFLTREIDATISATLHNVRQDQEHDQPPPHGYGAPPPDHDDHRYGPPQLVFTVYRSGHVTCDEPSAQLPAQDRDLVGPATITVGGTTMRAVGGDIAGNHVVIAQSMESVLSARLTLIVAESVVAPLLLLLVFLGALTIGHRVASPIEATRQRQLAFTADASHELRTPLSVIEAITSLALQGDREREWYRRSFAGVHRESRRMRSLVDDLLWLARFDAADRPRQETAIDLAVLAQATVDRFQVRAEERGLRLQCRPAGPAVLTAPTDWLDRLLGVLLDNACKYAPSGGSVRVSVHSDGRHLHLEVEDSGPGIPEEERRNIFERFHRATDERPGAGLGLAIADAIVRATGGQWRVGTSPLGGASVTVVWTRP